MLLSHLITLIIVVKSEWRIILTSLIDWRNPFPLRWLWSYWFLTVTEIVDFFFNRNLLWHFNLDSVNWDVYIWGLLKSKSWITYSNNFLWTIANNCCFILPVRRLLLDLLLLIITLFAWNLSRLLWDVKRSLVFKMLIIIMLIKISLTAVNVIFNIFLIH